MEHVPRPTVSSRAQGGSSHVPAKPVPPCALEVRVRALEDFYRRVQHERMQGIPLLNLALAVEAVGFRWTACGDADPKQPPVAEGVLVTPWFMSLVRLPAGVTPHQGRTGRSRARGFGIALFDFIGAHDPAIGFHETCALFSPMDGFDSQARARDTAREVLALLRQDGPGTALAREFIPARRAFFLARAGALR